MFPILILTSGSYRVALELKFSFSLSKLIFLNSSSLGIIGIRPKEWIPFLYFKHFGGRKGKSSRKTVSVVH